jgi:hypothetical protein
MACRFVYRGKDEDVMTKEELGDAVIELTRKIIDLRILESKKSSLFDIEESIRLIDN